MSTLARIATVCQNGRGHSTVEGNVDSMLSLFDLAAKQRPDLVCLPEAFTKVGLPKELAAQTAEPVPGPTIDAFAERAKRHRCYVICSIRTARHGQEWNSAVVIDRDGQVAGSYDKAQPVTTSPDYTVFEGGLLPGPTPPPVFDLDFGRIGIQICFDAGFPESWQALADAGAKVVFWPSAYHGGFTLQTYARLHNYYVISSVRTQNSRVIDPCGRVRVETDQFVNVAVWTLNTDFVVAHNDFNWGVPQHILAAYGDNVRISSYRDDGHFIVEPLDNALTAAGLQAEFGFESTREYHDRHRTAYQTIHRGGEPAPQTAKHGGRAQYSR